jgi:hypothetical protein
MHIWEFSNLQPIPNWVWSSSNVWQGFCPKGNAVSVKMTTHLWHSSRMDGDLIPHFPIHVFNMQHLHASTILTIAHSNSRSETLNLHSTVKCWLQNIHCVAQKVSICWSSLLPYLQWVMCTKNFWQGVMSTSKNIYISGCVKIMTGKKPL